MFTPFRHLYARRVIVCLGTLALALLAMAQEPGASTIDAGENEIGLMRHQMMRGHDDAIGRRAGNRKRALVNRAQPQRRATDAGRARVRTLRPVLRPGLANRR